MVDVLELLVEGVDVLDQFLDRLFAGLGFQGVPRSQETAPSPRATIGPYAESYCRVLGGAGS